MAARQPADEILVNQWREMAQCKGPCITLVLPLKDSRDFKVRLQSALRRAEAALPEPRPELLQSLRDLEMEPNAKNSTLVVVASPGFRRQFVLPGVTEEERVITGERFDVRPLLRLTANAHRFHILALSQNRTRLLLCTDSSSEEVPLPPHCPVNLMDFEQSTKPDHVLDNMQKLNNGAHGAMKGVMFGTGVSERDNRSENLEHFFKAIDTHLRPLLLKENLPLIVAGVEYELALFQRVATYPHRIEEAVKGAPDGLRGGEMHTRALKILAGRVPEEVARGLGQFEKAVGTDLASRSAREIVKAAFDGRVSQLFLQEDACYSGEFDETRQRVHGHSGTEHDLLGDAALETLVHGGQVHVLPASAMPNGVPVAAIFRYPLPSPPQ